MTAQQLPLVAQAHNNQQLFSDYYLNVILPRRDDWRALTAAVGPTMAKIAAIFADFTPGNEAQTERDLVQPVLDALGHTFEVQAPLKTPDGTKKPDYVFYRDRAARDANRGKALTEALLAPGGVAVGDAKLWDRPLDVAIKGAGDAFTNRNPSYQIAFYMQYSGLPWGILTNGRLWRLYHEDSAHRFDRYYEVDLAALVARGDPAQFAYFSAFFHRSAFDPHPLGVAALLRESTDYARAVGDTLKAQVYDALRHLAQGFLDYPGNRLQPDPETLRAIYENALIVLYRLLFILYAEARELLPLRESTTYRESYSLYAIAHQVAEDLRRGRMLLPGSAKLWPGLRELFGIVDRGSPPLRVATFDGGLFDPERHPFLERHTVGDAHLQLAIDTLARVKGEFVDYRDLAEQHLGTIYEGLLEYHLRAIEPEDGWTIGVFNDKGERKATGSYYTPSYVVKYIVEQAVGPVLDEAVEGLDDDRAKVAAVLGVNVLDPAMGSGYFLVEVTEYIARFLVDLAVTPDGAAHGETDLTYWRRQVAQSCVYGVDVNPLAVELAKLSLWLTTAAKDRPLSFLDHHLRVGNALVGARLADLRFGRGKKGASTKPGKKEREAVAAGQLSMLDDDAFRRSLGDAVGSMWRIEGAAGDTIAEVKEQERVYAALRADLDRRYGRLADLVTGTHFALEIDPALLAPLADYATGRRQLAPAKFDDWLDTAAATAAERRFFHWELEFPEVFFDRTGQPLGSRAGFDAVVGNPPYVRQEQLAQIKPYLANVYSPVYHGAADLYVYFYRLGLVLLRVGGTLSFIVTNKWLRSGYGERLRAYFAASADIEQIVDFGHAPIFHDADTFPVIVVLRKRGPRQRVRKGQETRVAIFPRDELRNVSIPAYVQEHGYNVPMLRFGAQSWSLEPPDSDELMDKIRRAGAPLAEYTGAKPFYGVKTGLNDAFVIDTPTKERLLRDDPRSGEIIRPFLRGQDIKRWVSEWNGQWLIFARRGIDIDCYPAIKRHLLQYRERLEPKPRGWIGEKWPGRKPGLYEWYEVQDPVAYWQLFDQPKIVYPDIAWRSQFAYDRESRVCNNTGYFLPVDSPWILAILNSPLMWWYCWRGASHGKDEALRFFGDFVETLPVVPPPIGDGTEVDAVIERLTALTEDQRSVQDDVLAWLQAEFEIAAPGQRLEALADLDQLAFIEEVRRRRPHTAGRLSAAAVRDLRDAYDHAVPDLRALAAEARKLEYRLSNLVNQAYGLTAEDIDLMWRTAPPRMPVAPPAEPASGDQLVLF